MQQDFNPFKYLANPKVSAPDRQLENERNQTEPTVCVVHSSSESSEWKAHTTVMNIFAIPFTFFLYFLSLTPASQALQQAKLLHRQTPTLSSATTHREERERSQRENESNLKSHALWMRLFFHFLSFAVRLMSMEKRFSHSTKLSDERHRE